MKNLGLLTILVLSMPFLSYGQWENRFNGQGDFSDKFNTILTDDLGNIYQSGSTINPEQGRDLLLVKLNSSGDTTWTSVYNGPGNGNDEALAMAMDADGNIYTTGYQKGFGTGYDFITVKYSSAGEILWTATYNYVSNEFDQSNSIAVDDAGNVFIAGQSDQDASITNNDDYVVIKYNADGTTAWAKRTNGAGNSTDRPVKIIISTDGNLIVTGRSDNLSDDDYMTLKYDADTGDELWRKYFDRTHHDRPTGMVIDPSNGRIYITGRSNNGTNYDYATLCYNTSGTLQWQTIFDYVDDDRATAIGIDGSGNIYVTGQSDIVASTISTDYDILTVKYNSSGTQQWAQSWGGSAANDDIPNAIFVDNSGNSFIAGSNDTDPSSANISNDFIVVKYNTTGTLQYDEIFSASTSSNDVPAAITADASANIFVTGSSETIPDKNGTTIKLNSSGDVVWDATYDGTGDNSDNSHAILKDAAGNVYVAGYTLAYGADRNFLLMKLNAAGAQLWEKELNGTSTTQSTDDAIAMCFDGTGNICVTGFVKNSGTGYDIKLAKFNTSGDTLWTTVYNYDLANETDKALAIGVDGSNNIYVTGRSDQDASIVSNDDIVTLKFGSNGSFKWAQRYNGSGNGIDNAKAMQVTDAGNVYVAGKTLSATEDIVLIKYDNLGAQQWVKKYDGGGDDECTGMVMDADENIYITGNSINTSGDHSDIITLKYNSSGVQQWVSTFDNATHGNDDAKSVVLDRSNNIIVCGTTASDTSAITLNGDIITLKYDNDGNELWVKMYDGDAAGNDDASEVAVDPENHIYVTGQADNGTSGITNYDYITIQYDAEGNETELQDYNGTGDASDVANTLAAFDSTYYVSGGSNGGASQRDIVTILYGKTPVAIESFYATENILIYPNPVTEYAMVQLPEILNNGKNITITVSDIEGNLLQNISTGYQPEIKILNPQYPAGIYFLNIYQDQKPVYHSKINVQ